MQLRFQNNNQPLNSPQKSMPQQGQKSTTSMNMNIRQLSVSQRISSMIVPVYLSQTSCPGQRKLVYAMLESKLDLSFIIDQTLNDFNIKAEETVINLSTMNATLPIMCRKADGFQVKGHGCFKIISLPTLYSLPEFPSDRSQIPSAKICNQFDHLRPIANKLLPLQMLNLVCFWDTMSATSTSLNKLGLQGLTLTPPQFEHLLAGVSLDQADAPALQIE